MGELNNEHLSTAHAMSDTDYWAWHLIAKVVDHMQEVARVVIPIG
jgi:hypothetical protein